MIIKKYKQKKENIIISDLKMKNVYVYILFIF